MDELSIPLTALGPAADVDDTLDVTVPTDDVAPATITCDKLRDTMTPGALIEFTPDQADAAGAFVEEAISEDDARESTEDLWFAPQSSPEAGPLPGMTVHAA